MPGISIRCGEDSSNGFENDLQNLLYFDHYEYRELYCDEKLSIGFTGYDAYPITTYETSDFIVFVEGKVYSPRDDQVILDLVDAAFTGSTDELHNGFHNLDAEAIFVAVEKGSGEIVVLNDPLARLPLYYHTSDEGVVLSRELGFVLDSRTVAPDSLGIAQQLLFGYPLGTRTPFSNVTQVPPGSLVHIVNDKLDIEQIYQFNVEQKDHRSTTLEENSKNLAKIFSEACYRRAGDGTNIVSLSGGLDSRAIAAGLSSQNVSYIAATYNRGTDVTDSEARTAKQVTDTLGTRWYECLLNEVDSGYSSTLLETKRGLNSLRMSYILEFSEKLRSNFEDITFFTGDGGDKTVNLSPPRSFSDCSEIVNFLISDQSRFDIDDVVELTNVPEYKITSSILDRLHDYPESDPTQKYMHFILRERGMNWVTHGEDRNRYFFWHTAPFFAFPLFKYAMAIPDEQKGSAKLYQQMIEEIQPDVLNIEYADFGAPVNSYEYKIKNYGFNLLSKWPVLRGKLIDRFRGSPEIDEGTAQSLVETVESSGDITETFSESTILEFANGRRSCSPAAADYLLTTIASLEYTD